jgi:hypothetical protein
MPEMQSNAGPPSQPSLVRAIRPLSIAVILFLLCCGFCWKLVRSDEFTWIDNPDIVHMDVPRLQFQRVTWQHGEFPLWDPHLWCGQPFLGEIVGAAFPVNWPFFWKPFNHQLQTSLSALNWYFVVLHFLAALAAWWLCRQAGTSPAAAVFGGFLYSFCGFVGLTRWPEILSSLIVAPLVLAFLWRALWQPRGLGNAALSGMFLGLAWLGGHHEVPIYLSTAVAAIWIWQILSRRSEWRRYGGLAAVSVLFAILTSGLQTIPGYEYARLASRWVGLDHAVEWNEVIPYRIDAQNALPPAALIGVAVPWETPNAEAFIGIVALGLALIGVFARWRERSVPLFACLAMAGLLLSLGDWNIFHGLLYAVTPLFGKARSPLRLLSIFDLGVAVLAAWGVDSLRMSLAPAVFRVATRALALFGAGVFVLGLYAPALQKPGPNSHLYVAGLLSLVFAGLLAARQYNSISDRAFLACLFALMFIELGNGSAAIFIERKVEGRASLLPELTRYHDIADFLRAQEGPVRVNEGDAGINLNLGDWEGIDTLIGYGAGVTTNILSLNWPSVRVQNLLGVNYALSRQAAGPGQQVVFHGGSGFNVLKNPEAFPRVWIVHQTSGFSSRKDLLTSMNDASVDLRKTVLLTGAVPELENCTEGESAIVSKRTANSVVIDARLACRGMLILSDTWYPGWSAKTGGKRLPIYEAYSALRGVVLEKGEHYLEFRYRPASALLGGGMTLAGVVCAFTLAFRERHRSRRTAERRQARHELPSDTLA